MSNGFVKYKSLFKICNNFVNKLYEKYNNNITVSNYIFERLIEKNVNIAYCSTKDYDTTFKNFTNNYSKFDIIYNRNEFVSSQCALSYAKHTDNLGVIFNKSKYGYRKIFKTLDNAFDDGIPLMLISLYDKDIDNIFKCNLEYSQRFIKVNYNVETNKKFPNIMEYLINISELPKKGPVHLNICNKILNKQINLKDIDTYKKSKVISTPIISNESSNEYLLKQTNYQTEEENLLQYLEKRYQ